MNVVENMSELDNYFYHTQINRYVSAFNDIGDN